MFCIYARNGNSRRLSKLLRASSSFLPPSGQFFFSLSKRNRSKREGAEAIDLEAGGRGVESASMPLVSPLMSVIHATRISPATGLSLRIVESRS